MDLKKCKQCGKWKAQDDFRVYSNRNSYHTKCKKCESLNASRIRLEKKVQSGAATTKDRETLSNIYKLYEVQRGLGLKPPTVTSNAPLSAVVESALAEYSSYSDKALQTGSAAVSTTATATTTPAPNEQVTSTDDSELQEWLTKDLSNIDLAADEDYLDNIMDKLDKKYRPVVGRDEFTLKPIYDETYRDLLNEISERFDKYTEEFWNGLE